MRYSGQPALCSIAPQSEHYFYYTSTWRYSFYHGILEEWQYIQSTRQSVPLHSMYCCCCITGIHAFVPKFCRPKTYQDKHDPWAKHQHYIPADLLQKIYKCSNYSPPQAVTNFVEGMIHISMRSSHNCIADNRENFLGPIEGHYSVQAYRYSILSQYPRILAVLYGTSQSVPVDYSKYWCCIP